MVENKDIDIIKNMKTIEWLKAELLTNVATLHQTLLSSEKNTKENLEDILSNIILGSYVLGKRLGLSYSGVQAALKENIRLNLVEEHKIERWYGDLSQLLEYIHLNDE